jgi:hypothetical protein
MNRGIIPVLLFLFILMLLCGCAFEGKVYLSFFWYEGQKPTTFTCTAPDTPPDANSLEKGTYYHTESGSWNLQYDYGPTPSWNFNFTLDADSTVLGGETAYYDITLFQYAPPVLIKVPEDS